jgi:hypothetical protein
MHAYMRAGYVAGGRRGRRLPLVPWCAQLCRPICIEGANGVAVLQQRLELGRAAGDAAKPLAP